MRKQSILFIAGGLGIAIGFGIFGARKIIARKRQKYNDYYADYHRNFIQHPAKD